MRNVNGELVSMTLLGVGMYSLIAWFVWLLATHNHVIFGVIFGVIVLSMVRVGYTSDDAISKEQAAKLMKALDGKTIDADITAKLLTISTQKK